MMKARLGCIPCFVKQGLSAVRLSTQDPAEQQRVLDEVLRRIQGLSLDSSPALLSQVVYATVREMTGVADPFAQAKRETNRRALALLPELRRRIAASPDPLHAAIRAALIGNVVDLGIGRAFDLERDVAQGLETDLAVDDYPAFRAALKDCRRLLYVCDNSGEIAFDRLLIEDLRARCEVTASVKSRPIINDATMQDAEEVGLTAVADVIETGSGDIGVNWERSSREFVETFRAADLVLAKGQGNFETLDETPGEIFFLLKAKCPEVAAELGVAEGAQVFLRSRSRRPH
jgi:uncharacterized protein with ATP-grasp and redox domains